MADDELRILRDRLDAIDAAFDLSQAGDEANCAAAMLCQTTTVSSYPTTAATFYAVVPCDINGAETEGGAATYVPRTGTTAYALNLGTQIPPNGTTIVVHAVGGRWCFRYDG